MEKNTKIIHLTTLDLSGAGRAAMRIVDAQCRAGWNSLLLCLFKRSKNASKNVVQYNVPNMSLWKRILKKLHLFTPAYIETAKRLKAYKVVDVISILHSDCKPENDTLVRSADILNLHWVHDFVDLRDFLNKTTQPIIWTLHDQGAYTGCCCYANECQRYMDICGACPALSSTQEEDYSTELWKEKYELYQKHASRLHIVCCSNWMADCARQSALMKHLDIRVIPNCIDTDLFTPSPLPNNSRKISLLFGAMNAKDKYKGYLRLVEVLALMSTREDFAAYDIEVLILGENSDGVVDLPYPTRYLGFINNDSELVKVYQESSLLLYASYRDNLPNMIMESMACGTPVVAFDVGGISDLIDHKENGYLAQTQDDFVDGVLWALQNRSQLSQVAREKVIRCFVPEVVAKQYIQCYQEALNGK